MSNNSELVLDVMEALEDQRDMLHNIIDQSSTSAETRAFAYSKLLTAQDHYLEILGYIRRMVQ